jgi:hypothetical protein
VPHQIVIFVSVVNIIFIYKFCSDQRDEGCRHDRAHVRRSTELGDELQEGDRQVPRASL